MVHRLPPRNLKTLPLNRVKEQAAVGKPHPLVGEQFLIDRLVDLIFDHRMSAIAILASE